MADCVRCRSWSRTYRTALIRSVSSRCLIRRNWTQQLTISFVVVKNHLSVVAWISGVSLVCAHTDQCPTMSVLSNVCVSKLFFTLYSMTSLYGFDFYRVCCSRLVSVCVLLMMCTRFSFDWWQWWVQKLFTCTCVMLINEQLLVYICQCQ